MGQLTTKETAGEMRKKLREQFPGTKFSVRMARGTAYGWIDVQWTDGPALHEVNDFTKQFESRRFDGMDDSYKLTGNTRYSCCGVSPSRTISDELRADVESRIERDVDGLPFITREDGRTIAAERGDEALLVYRYLNAA